MTEERGRMRLAKWAVGCAIASAAFLIATVTGGAYVWTKRVSPTIAFGRSMKAEEWSVTNTTDAAATARAGEATTSEAINADRAAYLGKWVLVVGEVTSAPRDGGAGAFVVDGGLIVMPCGPSTAWPRLREGDAVSILGLVSKAFADVYADARANESGLPLQKWDGATIMAKSVSLTAQD